MASIAVTRRSASLRGHGYEVEISAMTRSRRASVGRLAMANIVSTRRNTSTSRLARSTLRLVGSTAANHAAFGKSCSRSRVRLTPSPQYCRRSPS